MAQFQPRWDEQTVRRLVSSYKDNPQRFPETYKQNLRQHTDYYNVPFYEGEFSIADALTDFGAGFIEGFTTLHIGDEPDNEYEAIFKNLGHLAGFAPGIISAPLGAVQKVTKSTSLLTAANVARSLNDKSVPMAAAKIATKFAKDNVKPFLKQGRMAKNSAVNTASNFLMGDRARHIAEGAFHLGAASAVSAWQGGVDEMMAAFIGGAQAGGVFRGIGNFINTGSEAGTKVAKTVAGSLFMGLPATMRGATTPEQVYEYVMGAWFGGQERPWTVAKAGKFVQKFEKDSQKKENEALRILKDPEIHPDFKELPSEVKPVVKEMFQQRYNQENLEISAAAAKYMAEKGNIDLDALNKEIINIRKAREAELEQQRPTEEKVSEKDLEKTSIDTPKEITVEIPEGTPINPDIPATTQVIDNVAYKFPRGVGFRKELLPQKAQDTLNRRDREMDLLAEEKAASQELDLAEKKKDKKAIAKAKKRFDEISKKQKELKAEEEAAKKEVPELSLEKTNVKKIISGGQIGADQFGLEVGKELGIETGGTAPPKFQTTKGSQKEILEGYGLVEGESDPAIYVKRTIKNVKDSDGTVLFGDEKSRGSALTIKAAMNNGKHIIVNPTSKQLTEWISKNNIEILNVAGNRNIAADKVKPILTEALSKVSTFDVVSAKKTTKKEDINLGSTNEDNVGVAPISDPEVGRKAYNIVRYDMPDLFKEMAPAEKQIAREGAVNKIGAIIDKYLTKNTGILTNKSSVAVTKIKEMLKKDYNYVIKNTPKDPERADRFEGNLRQWLGRFNNDEVVDVLTYDGNTLKKLTKKNPKNAAGNKKILEEPYKIVDNIWENLTGKKERAFVYLDNITIDTKDGKREITPKKLKDSEYADYGGEKDYYDMVSDVIKKMDKQGYNYSGGKGTNDRLYFRKYHPNTKNVKNRDILKNFKPSDIRALRRDFVKKFKAPGALFDKSFKSNLLWQLEINGLEYTPENVKKMLGDGFIGNAIALNKRLPLIMTDSYPAEKEFFKNYKDPDTGEGLGLTKDGNFKFYIKPDFYQDRSKKFQDKKKEEAKFSDIKSTETEENLDGAIIGRDDVVNALNAEKGTPESRHNKSLVVMPDSNDGGLFLKYAIHKAGPAESKIMKDAGLHFEVYDSAAKQKGTRKFYEEYELDPKYIRQDYGIKQSKKFIEPQSLKKQMVTNLVESLAANPKLKDGTTMNEVVEDIYNTLTLPKFEGVAETNKAFRLYQEKLKTASNKELAAELDKLNFEEIGITELVDGLKLPGNQLFAKKFYNHLLLKRKESLLAEFEDGEIGPETYKTATQEIEDFNTVAEKMIAASRRDAIKRKKPENELNIFLHPDLNKFRMKVLSSWIINQATRPKVKNSASAIIRPYDFSLQTNADGVNPKLKELNTNKELFFVGDEFKRMPIETEAYGRTTLNELWKISQRKNTPKNIKEDIKEILRAAIIRVPSDSNSGTQVLEFAGFTGRKDYGVLMHGLVKRALGGADHDIDSAYLYFGGKGGFKKSWKDMFKAQAEEFYEKQPDGRFKIADNKAKEFEKKLIEEYSANEDALFKSKAGMFAPNTLMQAAEGATEGRGLLGGAAVNPKNILASAYEMIMQKGKDEFTMKHFGKDVKVTLTPKTKPQEKQYINKLMRATVGFASDAMDYGKPKGYESWYKQALDAHFNITTDKKIYNFLNKVNLNQFIKEGVIGKINNANKAYYSKDYTRGRQWTMEERRNMTKDLYLEPSENVKTITPRIARLLYNIDYSDNILNRIDAKKMTDLFKIYNENVSQYKSLKDPLGRVTFKAITGKHINRTLTNELTDPDKLIEVAENDAKFQKIIEGTNYEFKKKKVKGKWVNTKVKKEYNKDERIALLNKFKEEAADYAGRDMQTLVTVKLASDIIKDMKKRYPNLTDAQLNQVIENASKAVSKLKFNNYLLRENRNKQDEDLKTQNQVKSKGTAALDQNEVDLQIREWKQNKTELEKDLFDVLMLGSLNRGNLKKINELRSIENPTDAEKLTLSEELQKASKTSSSMLGYNSEAVNPKNLERFLGEINDKFSEVAQTRTAEENKIINKSITEEPQKQENIEKGWPEDKGKDANALEEVFTTGWEGVKKAKKIKLDSDTKSYIDDILLQLKTEPNHVMQNIGFIARKVIGKDINIFNKQDWFQFRNWLQDIKNGTLWQRLKSEDFTKVSQRTYLQFPETINRELMRDEITVMQENGIFLTAEGTKAGRVIKPTQHMDILQTDIGNISGVVDGINDKLSLERAKTWEFLDGFKDGTKLWEVAWVTRELPNANRLIEKADGKELKLAHIHAKTYKDNYKKILEKHNYESDLKNKEYIVTIEGNRKTLTGKELVDYINKKETEYYKERGLFARGDVPLTKNGDLMPLLNDKGEILTKNGQIMYALQKSLEFGIPGFTSGPKNSGYLITKTKPNSKLAKEFPTGYYDPKTRQNPVIDIPKFVNDMKKNVAFGKPIPEQFGIDGINSVGRSAMYEMARHGMNSKEKVKMYNTMQARTGRIKEEMYTPHSHFNKKTALKSLEDYANYLSKQDIPLKEQEAIIKSLAYRHNALAGDFMFEEINHWEGFNAAISKIAKSKEKNENRINWLKSIGRSGSQFSRTGHMPGYSLSREVPLSYGKSFNNIYYRQLSQIFSRDTISKFEKSMFDRKVPTDVAEAWSNFAKLYVQGAIGNPDVVPEYIYNDPKMKIKGTPYGWWADNRVRDRLNKIGDKLGLIKEKENLPENMRGLDLNDIKRWSNLEAKFELASLLAHPKSMVANIFGGTMHTVQSVGFNTWKNARNDKYMSTINPDFGTKEQRNQFAIKHGILPEQLIEEYGLNRGYQSAKNKEFIETVARKMRRDPEVSSESIRELAKEQGIGRKVTEFAAKFMSVPEKALRRDAFMAHYLHWYNKFGGTIKNFNHPVLIELAKKGVKATQFLYSAPFRPMFARTALGKVMTRFQLWGWNAVKFRKEALKEARQYGFKGAEADKFARMMQLDLFVFALGNAFAYSLFDTAMPAPYNWFQDTSEWIFGDEKERNRAFFGQWPRAVAPLQMITPPILRLPMASMRAILEDDWERISNYYIHTMYPFGRISRDFVGPNNLIENPLSAVDKWTGFPLLGLSKASKDLRKGKERTVPTPGSGLSPF